MLEQFSHYLKGHLTFALISFFLLPEELVEAVKEKENQYEN